MGFMDCCAEYCQRPMCQWNIQRTVNYCQHGYATGQVGYWSFSNGNVYISETSEKAEAHFPGEVQEPKVLVRFKSYHLHGEEPPLVELAFFQKSYRKWSQRNGLERKRNGLKRRERWECVYFRDVGEGRGSLSW